MPLPNGFGPDWESFARTWYLGSDLGYSPSSVESALTTLERLWPEKLETAIAAGARGLVPVIELIDWGLTIAACESIPAFAEVFARARGGERGAYSELVMGEIMHGRFGYSTKFAAPHAGKVLDLSVRVGETDVLVEVAAPEVSEENEDVTRIVRMLSNALQGTGGASHIEVEVLDVITEAQALGLAAFAKSVYPAAGWWDYQGIAKVRKLPLGEPRPPLFDGTAAVEVWTASDVEPTPDSCAIVVRYNTDDGRAERLLKHEYRHLSNDVANLLVFNTCAVGGDGLKSWADSMASELRADQLRNVGALAFFRQGIGAHKMDRQWRVIANPFAHHPLPTQLLASLANLNTRD